MAMAHAGSAHTGDSGGTGSDAGAVSGHTDTGRFPTLADFL